MKNKTRGTNVLGAAFALVTLGIVIFSIVYLTGHRSGLRPCFRPLERWGDRDFGSWKRTEEERRVDEAFSSLRVQNISGSIEIRGWDRNYSLVRYTRQGPFTDELEVVIELKNQTLSVYPVHANAMRKPPASVSFEIAVPEDVHSIIAGSVSGSIELFGMGPEVDQELKTVSGRIETDNAGDLRASATSGPIRFRFSGRELYVKTVSGRVSGDILDLARGGTCELASVSGPVTLNAFKELDTRLALKSTSGTVHCEFPIQTAVRNKNLLEGTIGEGSSSIEITSTSGSISLNRR